MKSASHLRLGDVSDIGKPHAITVAMDDFARIRWGSKRLDGFHFLGAGPIPAFHLAQNYVVRANPDDIAGVGISVEADTSVTGNVVEQAANVGIGVGWGQSLRDVTVTGNIIRAARMGIAVSVVPGAGSALIANNLIADTPLGAVVGVAWKQPVTKDLTRGGADRFAQLTIGGNQTR